MLYGHAVCLRGAVLGRNDLIIGQKVEFTPKKFLGVGSWLWSGAFGTKTILGEFEPGRFFEDADKFIYFVPDCGPACKISYAIVESCPINPPSEPAKSNSPEDMICFTSGTKIRTPECDKNVESLKPGDLVETADRGAQPVRWVGQQTVRATGAFAPIKFAKGAIGNVRDLRVSPHHRMILNSAKARDRSEPSEVFVPARDLVNDFDITVEFGGMVTYVHILFDQHEVVFADGTQSESFFPDDKGMRGLTAKARAEIFDLFPDIRSDLRSYGPAARASATVGQTNALAMAL